MVNPAFPKNQLVGVFSLDLARLYNYLYQKTDKNFMIIFGLDGYDEISLTAEFKMISNASEQILSAESFGFNQVKQQDIFGGNTVEEAAKIFMNVLEDNGTEAQKNVVLANTAMALKCIDQNKSIQECVATAKESLESKKALTAFKKLISINN